MGGGHNFSKGISPKVNLIVRQEFDLSYFEAAVQHINHYVTRIGTSVVAGVAKIKLKTMLA